jgi:hypothetical protein
MIRASHDPFDDLVMKIERVRAEEGLDVALQMHRLVREYELDESPAAAVHIP